VSDAQTHAQTHEVGGRKKKGKRGGRSEHANGTNSTLSQRRGRRRKPKAEGKEEPIL